MIRILENGQYRVVKCSCGCKYSFDSVDINSDNQVPCPECGTMNTVKVKEEA